MQWRGSLREKLCNLRALFMPHVISITQHARLQPNSLHRLTPGASIEWTTKTRISSSTGVGELESTARMGLPILTENPTGASENGCKSWH
jgi:hypothetical protein